MREFISNGTPRMPGFQAPLPAGADRRHRRLSQDRPSSDSEDRAMRKLHVLLLAARTFDRCWRTAADGRRQRHRQLRACGRDDGRRDGVGQAGGRHDHHHRADRRSRPLLLPAACRRQIPRLGARRFVFATAKSDDRSRRGDRSTTSRSPDAGGPSGQLPGNVMLAALPEDNEQDKRMKVIVRNNCTGLPHRAAMCCSIASTKPAGTRSSS